MPKTGRPARRMLGFLLSLCAGLALGRAPQAGAARDLGALQPFYRATQLQGHLIGMGLQEIPDYLTAPDIDLAYRPKPGMTREIPFVDTFSINRFLGGYPEEWLRKLNDWDEALGRRSLDYAVRQANGSLRFRPELIRRRLEPYLAAGYRPQDITIALENVPWDLSTPGGGPPETGAWGRRSPPGDLEEWARLIRQFAADLPAYLGPEAASAIQFETGVEYDGKASFDASAPEFFRFYEATDRALHAVLPEAALSPGEFTGAGTCTPEMPNCVYDTREFLAFAARERLAIPDVPRSLHSFLDRPANAGPSITAERALQSYARLPPVVAEVHQFGLLDEPFGPFGHSGSDTAARRANWEFQVLMRLWEGLRPRRVFHWGGFDGTGKLALLNGPGFLRLVLDRYVGSRGMLLDAQEKGPPRPQPAEIMAVGFNSEAGAKSDAGSKSEGRSAVILSSFSLDAAGPAREVTVTLPPGLLAGGGRPKTIRYRQSENVHALIRRDLAGEDNLTPEFAACPQCLAAPILMARDADRARAPLRRQWPRYVEAIKETLRWRQDDPGIAREGTRLRVTLEPNELVIIE
ncbi:MAG: hypothetical protein JO058_06860 [Alphaproteobacteria bacterium]|nr:hypothetical protein [Alphaproteobacteria bacterium]